MHVKSLVVVPLFIRDCLEFYRSSFRISQRWIHIYGSLSFGDEHLRIVLLSSSCFRSWNHHLYTLQSFFIQGFCDHDVMSQFYLFSSLDSYLSSCLHSVWIALRGLLFCPFFYFFIISIVEIPHLNVGFFR